MHALDYMGTIEYYLSAMITSSSPILFGNMSILTLSSYRIESRIELRVEWRYSVYLYSSLLTVPTYSLKFTCTGSNTLIPIVQLKLRPLSL